MKHELLFGNIEKEIKQRHMLDHPFYKAWTMGKLTKDELIDYLKQYYYVESIFPRVMSALHSNTPDAKMRQKMLENLNEEELGKNNHVAQFMKFCKDGFGVTEEDIKATPPNVETVHLIEMLKKASSARDIREGLAAMVVYKQQVSDVAKTKIDGLMEYYGISDKEALKFYETHAIENTSYHEMLDNYIESNDQQVVITTVRQIRDSFWEFLDGVTTPDIIARCEA